MANAVRKSTSFVWQLATALLVALLGTYLVNRFVSSSMAHPISIEGSEWSDAFVVSVTQNPFWIDPSIPEVTISAFLICFLLCLTFSASADRKKQDKIRTGEEHGSARWAELAEMKKFKADSFDENVILSADAAISIPAFKPQPPLAYVPEKLRQRWPFRSLPGYVSDRNKHVLVVGGSGSGKTFNLVGPNLLQAKYSILSTDPKGDTVTKYGQYLIDRGYKVLIFNVKDPASFEFSMHYNPFRYITSQASIMELVNIIIENTSGSDDSKAQEDFWVKAERCLYMCLMGFLYYYFQDNPEQQTIPKMLDMISLASASEKDEDAVSALDMIIEDFKEELIEAYGSEEEARRGEEWFAITQYEGFKKAAGETAKSIIISCFVRLSPFAIGSLREMFSSDEIELEKIGEEKTALFVIMNDQDNTFNFILAMLLYQFFNINVARADASPGSHCKIPIMCFLDEIGSIGRIPDFDAKAATLRSRWINLIPILQNTSQLDKDYGKDKARIIKGNCDTTIYLGRSDDETNEEFSKRLGDETIMVKSYSDSKNGRTTNYTPTQRKLMLPEEFGSNPDKFADDDCLVLIKNARPYKGKKYMLRDHPSYPEFQKCPPLDSAAFVQRMRVEKWREEKARMNAKDNHAQTRKENYLACFAGMTDLIIA